MKASDGNTEYFPIVNWFLSELRGTMLSLECTNAFSFIIKNDQSSQCLLNKLFEEIFEDANVKIDYSLQFKLSNNYHFKPKYTYSDTCITSTTNDNEQHFINIVPMKHFDETKRVDVKGLFKNAKLWNSALLFKCISIFGWNSITNIYAPDKRDSEDVQNDMVGQLSAYSADI